MEQKNANQITVDGNFRLLRRIVEKEQPRIIAGKEYLGCMGHNLMTRIRWGLSEQNLRKMHWLERECGANTVLILVHATKSYLANWLNKSANRR